MTRYECSVCGYVYDASQEGQRWDKLPHEWTCPICGAAKSQFQPVDDSPSDHGASEAAPAALTAAATVAPVSTAIRAHRVFGYVFLVIYVFFLFQMVPRLWTYQIEFPARTVVHLTLGMAIGSILLLKIAVVRFFRKLDQTLVPTFGTSLVVSSIVLIGISVPAAFREAIATSRLFTEENRVRVRELLAQTGLDESECSRWTSTNSLRVGQRVLRQECIDCHDLRTVLAKPRTPQNWRQTVRRMADRTTLLNPLEEAEQWQVTAYLVALSPHLRKSSQRLRNAQQRHDRSKQAAEAAAKEEVEASSYDEAAAKQLFVAKCSQCHETTLVSDSPPSSKEEARELVAWMVEEGLEASQTELALIVQHLTDTYAK